MSSAFMSAVEDHFENAAITVDWFHVVSLFTRALEEVRRSERKEAKFPKFLRWAVVKGEETPKTEAQQEALSELENSGFAAARQPPIASRNSCGGSVTRPAPRPRSGGSLTSSDTPRNRSEKTPFSSP